MKTYPSTQLRDFKSNIAYEIEKSKKEIRYLKNKKRIKQAYLIGLKKGAELATASTEAGAKE